MFSTKYKQRGAITVFFALSLPVLLGMTAFAVDLGNAYYQKSRLQGIADSAALAGGKKFSSKVILVPEDTIDQNFKELTDPAYKDKLAEATAVSKKMLLSTSETDKRLKEKFDDSDIYKKDDDPSQYYKVKLSKEVPTYFAGILGTNSIPISATSVAKAEYAGPVTEEEKEELIEKVNANIQKTIPDYYYESIEKMSGTSNKSNPEYHLQALEGKTSEPPAWGFDFDNELDLNKKSYPNRLSVTINNKKYYIYNYDSQKVATAYRDPDRSEDPQEDKDNNFAEPFLEANTSTLKYLYCTFKDMDFTNIKGAFLDMFNVSSTYVNYRGLVFDIGNDADKKLGNSSESFYIRIESEPIRILQGKRDQEADNKNKTSGRTLVAPKLIYVNETTRRPLVIAYDGPDQSRDQYDAPVLSEFIPFDKYDLNKGGKIKDITTAITSAAAFRVYLNKDFKGVIYAPRSHVEIYGSGKIDGFILAKKITMHNQIPTRTVTETESEVNIPVWILEREINDDGSLKGSHDNKFLWSAVKNGNYKEETLTSKFMIAYDDFYNYTIEQNEKS